MTPADIEREAREIAAELKGAHMQCRDASNQLYRCGRCRCPSVGDERDVAALIAFAAKLKGDGH